MKYAIVIITLTLTLFSGLNVKGFDLKGFITKYRRSRQYRELLKVNIEVNNEESLNGICLHNYIKFHTKFRILNKSYLLWPKLTNNISKIKSKLILDEKFAENSSLAAVKRILQMRMSNSFNQYTSDPLDFFLLYSSKTLDLKNKSDINNNIDDNVKIKVENASKRLIRTIRYLNIIKNMENKNYVNIKLNNNEVFENKKNQCKEESSNLNLMIVFLINIIINPCFKDIANYGNIIISRVKPRRRHMVASIQRDVDSLTSLYRETHLSCLNIRSLKSKK
ncbi:uncharacterized protein CMU_012320 [Cryptosporidium muris RN66]|uniref:Uncharacterized protein n=1 Tax=Cryptosporidium muris (strain RN66) TaxID=441375 RepID=B6AEE1_CRYMR|nr:uncharacterized protein CMU_012320 [Cryptosporidium muris RN66]EEA06558.1 hypothetical protein CMU_012320 [Cryptosporidium muris RN66]|eukprot:XP_002140907.1 hypothetical protein [Cryptosporidium muris RN66]